MDAQLIEYKLKALEDSYTIVGEPLFKEGKTYTAVRNGALIIIDAGGVNVVRTSLGEEIEGFEIVGFDSITSIEDTSIDSISHFMKKRSIEKWTEENVDCERVVKVRAKLSCCVPNSAGPHSGSEWFNNGDVYLGVFNNNKELLIQKRKGAIFYLGEEFMNNFERVEDYLEPNFTYDEMKEIRYIIENDYKSEMQKEVVSV